MKILTYKEVENALKGDKPNHLLLGNGFNIDYDARMNISEEEHFRDLDSLGDEERIEEFKYTDDKLKTEPDPLFSFRNGIVVPRKDSSELFVDKILEVHLKNADDFDDNAIKRCSSFLTPFVENGKIFTINYDMHLSWVLLRSGLKEKCSDGFMEPHSVADGLVCNMNSASLFYCHGAIFLYAWGSELIKIQMTENNLDGVNGRIKQGEYPVCISAGNFKDKLQKIDKWDYLKSCLETLKTIDGNLVVFGFSADERRDKHILEAIKFAQDKNGLNIYWGVHGNSEEKLQYQIEKLEEVFERVGLKNYEFYDSASARVWR